MDVDKFTSTSIASFKAAIPERVQPSSECRGVPRRNDAVALHSIIILCFNAYVVARKNIRGVHEMRRRRGLIVVHRP